MSNVFYTKGEAQGIEHALTNGLRLVPNEFLRNVNAGTGLLNEVTANTSRHVAHIGSSVTSLCSSTFGMWGEREHNELSGLVGVNPISSYTSCQ